MDYPVIDMTATGRNLDHMIRNSGYSVTDIADYLGATNSLVYRYMRGEVLPSTDRPLTGKFRVHFRARCVWRHAPRGARDSIPGWSMAHQAERPTRARSGMVRVHHLPWAVSTTAVQPALTRFIQVQLLSSLLYTPYKG